MSDWELLHDMHQQGYSADDIALAAGVGYAPWEEIYISRQWLDEELKDQPRDPAGTLKPEKPYKSRSGFPVSVSEQAEILEDLIDCADRHFQNTGRYLQVWGEESSVRSTPKSGSVCAAMGPTGRAPTGRSMASSSR